MFFNFRFDINQLKSTKETSAVNIRIMESQHPQQQQQSPVLPVPVASPPPPAASAASKSSTNPPEVGENKIAKIKFLRFSKLGFHEIFLKFNFYFIFKTGISRKKNFKIKFLLLF